MKAAPGYWWHPERQRRIFLR